MTACTGMYLYRRKKKKTGGNNVKKNGWSSSWKFESAVAYLVSPDALRLWDFVGRGRTACLRAPYFRI
jgi:hypothetical protein